MNSVFILHHSYEIDGYEETKLIGVYSSTAKAESAIERLKRKAGFRDRPDAFIIGQYELDQDHWSEGYSTMTTIKVKDINGNWKPVAAAVLLDGNYEIVEKYENDLPDDFKDGDIVRCELRDDGLYAVERVAH